MAFSRLAYRPILGVIAGAHRTLLVDAGNSPMHAQVLLRELANAKLGSPTYVALTHWHWDHVFGTSALPFPTFAHHETRRVVSEMATLDWSDTALDRRVEQGLEIAFCRDMMRAELPDRSDLTLRPPDISFTECVELDLGGISCQLIHVGGDHASDSTIVYVPEDKIVFLGDCIYPDIYHTARRYTTSKLFPLLDQLLKTVGHIVEDCAHNREAILTQIQHMRGVPVTDDDQELVDEFLAGLSGPTSERPL